MGMSLFRHAELARPFQAGWKGPCTFRQRTNSGVPPAIYSLLSPPHLTQMLSSVLHATAFKPLLCERSPLGHCMSAAWSCMGRHCGQCEEGWESQRPVRSVLNA